MGQTNSKIIISKNIKLEKDYKDVLDYTEEFMVNLCLEHAVRVANNYSFLRSERGMIKTSFPYEDALKCNYMAFQNPDYSNKWFFAFIDDVEYASDGTSKIKYTVDEFSTWYDYWNPQECFVVREHVNDDTIGKHTYPEGLEHGEYTINESSFVTNSLRKDSCYVCISTSYVPDNTPFVDNDRYVGNIYSGLTNLVMKTFEDASKLIKAYDDISRGDAIVNVYMLPSVFIPSGTTWVQGSLGDQTNINFTPLPNSLSCSTIDTNITLNMNTTLDSYTPKNNKLYCYPYNVLSITNNCGSSAEYFYEDFINHTPIFDVIALETSGVPAMLIPKNYKNITSATYDQLYSYGLAAGKFPTCSWKTDLFTNWMTQNGVNIGGTYVPMGLISGSAQMLIGAGTGSAEGILGGAYGMLSTLGEMYQHALMPPRINGQTTVGDLSFADDMLMYRYYKLSIKKEYAKIIDDTFTKFGYKINEIKLPNQIGRAYFNYVQIGQTENIGYSTNESRSVPAASMEVINNIFRKGVTIWHEHRFLGDYSVDNHIV